MIGLGERIFGKDTLRPEGIGRGALSLLLCTLAINILSLALPVMTLQIYDRILPNPGTGTLPVLVTGVCLAILLEAFLRLSRAYVISKAGASYEHKMSCAAIGKVLNADLSKMGSYGIGEYLQRMASVGKLRDFYNGYALTVFADLMFVPLYFILIVYIGHTLAFIPAIILMVFVLVSVRKGHGLRDALEKREHADDARFNFLIETLEGVHTLKAFALEKFFERRYEALEERSTYENYNVTQETASTFNMAAIFSHLMVISVVIFGAWCVLSGALTTGGMIATLLLSGRIMQPVQKGLALWTKYQDFVLARRNIEELFATPQQQIAVREEKGIKPFSDGSLEIRDVSYQHNGSQYPILRNVDLSLRRGDTILISGAHGCGKTTLLNLIAGIYPAGSGMIEVDGNPVQSYAPEELTRHIGFVRSNPLIFRGTIRDNITCFGQTDEAQAREVAALMNVDKDVAKLPGGFDTFLNGNNTDSIPPGLKQRIAIVRVLATKPRLILFDNADRSLDKEGYVTIYSLLARLKGKVSMILISEDNNIQALAERGYIINNGKLSEYDTFARSTNVRPYRELRL